MSYKIKTIAIQFVSLCNGGCKGCPSSSGELLPDIMPDLYLNKIINEVKKCKAETIVCNYNNEPFFDKTFLNRVSEIRFSLPKVKLEMSTNLSLCNEEKINKMAELKLSKLAINLFGLERETYESNMPMSTYIRVVDNLHYLSERFKEKSPSTKIKLVTLNSLPGIELPLLKQMAVDLNMEVETIDLKENKYCHQQYNDKHENTLYIRPNGLVCLTSTGNDYFIGLLGDRPLKEMISDKMNSEKVAKFFVENK